MIKNQQQLTLVLINNRETKRLVEMGLYMDMNFHKNFSPLYLALIVMFAMLISDKANAYDENNEAYCLAQNMYF